MSEPDRVEIKHDGNNRCCVCNLIIPESRQICPACDRKADEFIALTEARHKTMMQMLRNKKKEKSE